MIDCDQRNSREQSYSERIKSVHVPLLVDDLNCIHVLYSLSFTWNIEWVLCITIWIQFHKKQNNSKLFIKNKISITFSKKIDQPKPSSCQMEHQILKSRHYYFFWSSFINFKISFSFYSVRKTNDSEDFINSISCFLVFISVLLIIFWFSLTGWIKVYYFSMSKKYHSRCF